MSEPRRTVGGMSTATVLLTESCPVCASPRVDAHEPLWFLVGLDRDAALRRPAAPQFACADCGTHWD